MATREAQAANCSLDTLEYYMEWCLDHGDDPNCYPFSPVLSLWAGVWCVVNAVVGFSGNLLTLVAIPRAILSNKLGQHQCSLLCMLRYSITNQLLSFYI
jgi:hypothetical protein